MFGEVGENETSVHSAKPGRLVKGRHPLSESIATSKGGLPW